jgi:hypothetical protein
MSSLLFGGPPSPQGQQAASAAPGPAPSKSPPPPVRPAQPSAQRNNTLTVIAGVGVLLLAMGVGVLIGRAGNSKQTAPPAQVVTVAQQGTAATSGSTGEASFVGNWPAGTSGYTVQLQTLPQPGTTVASVEAAKTAAGSKGAKSVGALKSEEFSSLASGNYVIYSGVYHKQAEAEKALGRLKKSFPAAKVVKVSNGGAGSAGSGKEAESSSSSSGGVGSSESKPAPASVLKSLQGAKGKSYEQKSRNLPNVVETG